jgi:hypothetical protein
MWQGSGDEIRNASVAAVSQLSRQVPGRIAT